MTTHPRPQHHQAVLTASLSLACALLGLLSALALVMALAAPWVRTLSAATQGRVLGHLSLVLIVVMAITGILVWRRKLTERRAGYLIERFSHPCVGRWIGLAVGIPSLVYCASLWLDFELTAPSRYVAFSTSLWHLVIAVNMLTVRFWWGIDPQGLEVCERGIIFSGFVFLPWSEIHHFSWSGKSANQLNLFRKSLSVTNHSIPAGGTVTLHRILQRHISA